MYTGDLGTWNEDWFVTICGRKDDMIICSGENIYPTQIEEVLNQHPGVADWPGHRRPRQGRGQVVVAYGALRPGETPSALWWTTAARPPCSAYKRPRYYRLVDQLPPPPPAKSCTMS